jgi:SAM-dependent methyltransferase
MDRVDHWNHVYERKSPTAVSWYQPVPSRSLSYVRQLTLPTQRVIDVGGGAAMLVDGLLDAGYERPIVLDLSSAALAHVRQRLGPRATRVEWLIADVITVSELPPVDLWHDRAVLHFLTEPKDQAAYAAQAARAIRPGGHAVIGSFAPDGPVRCSGLPVQRHDGETLARLFGAAFELVETDRETHLTPGGLEQRFSWSVLRRQ